MNALTPNKLDLARFISPQVNVGLKNENSENLKFPSAPDAQVSQKTRDLSQKMFNRERVKKSIELPKKAASEETLYGLKVNHPALQKMINYFVKESHAGRPSADYSWGTFERRLGLYLIGVQDIQTTIRDLIIVDLEHEKFHMRQLQSPGFKKETEKINNQLKAIRDGASDDVSQETLLRIMSFLSSRYEKARSTQKTEDMEKLALLVDALSLKIPNFKGLHTENLQRLPKDCYWSGFENKLDLYLNGASGIEKTMRSLARVDLQQEKFIMRQYRDFKKEAEKIKNQLKAIRNGTSDAIPQETLFRMISFVFLKYYESFSAKNTQTMEKLAPLLEALERKMYHFKWDDNAILSENVAPTHADSIL